MPAKKKLTQYKGPLTLQQAHKGMELALANARRLYEDAPLLLDAERYPTALSLACLSIEESGKVSILRSFAQDGSQDEIADLWKQYRSHTRKNQSWAIAEYVRQDRPTRLLDLSPLFHPESEHPYKLDQIKQLGFYTDCLYNGQWFSPPKTVDKELATAIVQIAKLRCRKEPPSLRELELWREYMGTQSEMIDDDPLGRIIEWYAALQSEGLAEPGVNRMEQFITQGIDMRRRK